MARLEQRLEDHIIRVDARLLDLATDVRALSPLVIAHAEMAVKLTTAVEETRAANRAIESLEAHLAARDEEQRRRDETDREQRASREKAQRDERKKDRQWLIMALIAAVMMIIAATALMVG